MDLYFGSEYAGTVAYSDGHIYAFRSGGVPADAPWSAAHSGRSRNAVYPLDLMPAEPEDGVRLLVDGSFHGYPNPAGAFYHRDELNQVTFVCSTETGGTATIDIYDVAGTHIARHSGYAAAPKAEIPVDVSNLAGGLYVCKLSIKGGGGVATEFFKLAIKR